MEFSNHSDIVKKLIPALTLKEREEILAYYTVYEKYSKEFSEKATEDLKDHPVFGQLIKSIPKEVLEANNKMSMALQKDAILNDKWQPYIEYQIMQGITYAKMGLDFKSWYEVISMVRNYLNPYLIQEYGTGEKFISAINGMNAFMDIAMGIIGEAYMQEKKQIINEDAEKIKKLNEELEQKVIDRTAKLEASQNIFSTIFYKSPVMNTITDSNTGKFIDVNENFVKFIGLAKEEIIGKSSLELNLIPHPEHREEIIQSIKKNGHILDAVIEVSGKNGIRWVSSSVHAVNINGKDCFLSAMIDVTDRKKAEDQLISVNNELEAFTYSVSHDLRAPLRAVNGYAEMLNEDYGKKLDEEGKRIIENITYNATKMGILIDELLAFSRLGRKEVIKKLIDMNELTEGVLSEVNKAHPNSAKIGVNKLHDIKADYGLLHQVMYNLISNAIKYSSKEKDPHIEISSESVNGEIIFSIKDNGVGFDMKYSVKLFGVFQRLHSQEEFEGTGVGLAIVQRVIAKHDGKVWAEGEVNKGAKFNFSLTRN